MQIWFKFLEANVAMWREAVTTNHTERDAKSILLYKSVTRIL